ncbi:hypothetical protein pdam_00016775, partial [Pocillopora damicornis]
MLDDIQSQMSQNNLSSTQLFRSNADYFNNRRFKTSSNSMDSSSFVTQASTPNSFASQWNQKESEWFVSSSQRTQSRYLQPSLLYDEEEADNAHEVVAQDSPELFTQHSDFHLRGAPFNASELDMEDSEGFAFQDDVPEEENNQSFYLASVPRHNFDTPAQLFIPDYGDQPENPNAGIGLRSVNEIPNPFRSVFSKFPYFNIVQSKVFDEVMYTDRPLVVCAPTGSGKTVIFELAVIRLLMSCEGGLSTAKVVYMAPMKALCSERFTDWSTKFGPFGLRCKEVTGDSELDDLYELQSVHVIMTT